MFPKNSAFSQSKEQEEYLKGVRESALSTPVTETDGEALDQIRRDLKEHLNRYESDREQLSDQMDNK